MSLTPTQLRMAIAAAQVSLRELGEATDISPAHISRVQSGKAEATVALMRDLQLFFTDRGFRFEAYNGTVCVCVPDPPRAVVEDAGSPQTPGATDAAPGVKSAAPGGKRKRKAKSNAVSESSNPVGLSDNRRAELEDLKHRLAMRRVKLTNLKDPDADLFYQAALRVKAVLDGELPDTIDADECRRLLETGRPPEAQEGGGHG